MSAVNPTPSRWSTLTVYLAMDDRRVRPMGSGRRRSGQFPLMQDKKVHFERYGFPALQARARSRSEEHTSELQSHRDLHSFPTRRSSDLDGKWKAAQRSVSFDAGQKSAFREVRLSCIAGPCPFTKIQSEGLSDQDRVFSATVLNWSDTTTFLFEAEVVQRKPVSLERISYPVEFGETLDF